MNLRKEAKRAASLICESSCPTESQIDFMETVLREIHNEAIEAASQVVYRHSGNCDEFYEIRKSSLHREHEGIMKKRVSSSNLALRFYKGDGWTRECLEKYLTRGKLLDTAETHGDKPESAYFILDVGAALDMPKLYAEQVSEVHRAFNDHPQMSDVQ
jgi:hypothetical protein